MPKQIYLDNGKQFTARVQGRACQASHQANLRQAIPRGRGKIERYHSILWQEMMSQTRFRSLSHFRREMRKFERRYN
jgi:transposase InsO family protein